MRRSLLYLPQPVSRTDVGKSFWKSGVFVGQPSVENGHNPCNRALVCYADQREILGSPKKTTCRAHRDPVLRRNSYAETSSLLFHGLPLPCVQRYSARHQCHCHARPRIWQDKRESGVPFTVALASSYAFWIYFTYHHSCLLKHQSFIFFIQL